MRDWSSFQTDVLDVMRQYSGFMDFFEAVGSADRISRPDCLARITRSGKKEVWIVDAKHRNSLGEEDLERMDKYVERIRSSPLDAGLERSELPAHDLRTIFVAPESLGVEGHESVEFHSLHQFLQSELVYTDTDSAVRQISKMASRGKLTGSQARMLHQSLEPYMRSYREGMSLLESIESRYSGMELKKRGEIEGSLPEVDAALEHRPRGKTFLVDIPYSRSGTSERMEEIEDSLPDRGGELYYVPLAGAEGQEGLNPEELERRIRQEAGILPLGEVSSWFIPEVADTETEGSHRLKGDADRFTVTIESRDDRRFGLEASMEDKMLSGLKDRLANSRRSIGSFGEQRYRLEFEISEDFEVELAEREEPVESFRKTARKFFRDYLGQRAA